jgi:GalNAc-alpha-(1->4)-GalNAc-alpha-(1->3)-diNAcBac-PP-undecaprenol alpha-1,4-N-acetyl-D-galactosaminyltransferase
MHKKLTLLFTIPTLGAGGAERVLVSLLNYWADKDLFSLILVVHDDPRTLPFYPVHPSIKLIHTGFWRKHQKWRVVFSLYKIIKMLKPDGVVSFILWNNILTLLAARFACVPCLIAERSSPHVVKNIFTKLVRNWIYGWADRVVVQTQRAEAMFPKTLLSKIAVIANPIPRTETLSSVRQNLILSAGRLAKEKRFSVLIEALSLIKDDHKDWNLVIWGEGRERENLETIIREKGLEKRVSLPGATQEIGREMAKGSIFVLTSLFEGMPNALAEAMASGMAVISTDCPTGPRELITPFKDGLLVPTDDVKALAESIKKLILDKKMREDFGKKAAQSMQKYDIRNITSLWEKEFKKAFKG